MATTPLTLAEINDALHSLPGWTYERNGLAKEFTFTSFREAMSFMVRVGFEAEALNHHPDWSNVYNRVSVRLNTHDAGGKVTAKDIALARKIQGISWVG
ncbi:MAG TPA: 4a-hydroxytetrahydrobiopterin dehydratase [Candidatus Didemnitutus sp.]|nr:4a-hydroxytetrahydrobiopterin dehydratase [Candidatus Didemnitutus sp.]